MFFTNIKKKKTLTKLILKTNNQKKNTKLKKKLDYNLNVM